MKIEIIKEPPVFGPNYAKESLLGLVLLVDKNAPKKENLYAVKNEILHGVFKPRHVFKIVLHCSSNLFLRK